MFETGSLYSPSVLDITEEDLLSKAKTAIANITAVSLATSYPTQVRSGRCAAPSPEPPTPPHSVGVYARQRMQCFGAACKQLPCFKQHYCARANACKC